MSSSNTHELGAQAAFLASCVSQCEIPYSSPEKKFRIFNTDTLYSITIKDGLGFFTIIESDSSEETIINSHGTHLSSCSDLIRSEELIYDDFFEVTNGEATTCDYPEAAERGVTIYNHLIKMLNNLYCTKIANLHLAFAISIPNSKPKSSNDDTTNLQPHSSLYTCSSKQIVESYNIILTDVFSCIITENNYYQLLKTVPDGCDIISQLAILFSRYEFSTNQCICFKHVDELCPKAALTSLLKYKLSSLFFDCKSFDELYVYIKDIIIDINENNILQPVSLCPTCYNAYMIYESKRIKTTQLLKKYSRDLCIGREEERKQKKMEAMRKSEIRRVKKKSAHGCSSNLSYQERKLLMPDSSLLMAAKQTIKPTRKSSVSSNNFNRTSPLFNRRENSNQNQNTAFPNTTGKQAFSSTMPVPSKK